MSRLLIVGVARSGTTWTGRTLGHTDGAAYVNEPDGFRDPYAFAVMLRRGEHPSIAVGDDAPDYQRLWEGAFAGGRPAGTWRDQLANRAYMRVPIPQRRLARAGEGITPLLRLARLAAVPRVAEPGARHVIVKSVQSILAVDWVFERFRPQVLVVERNPLNVLASWIELDYVRDPAAAGRVAAEARARWNVEPPERSEPRLVHQAFTYGVLSCVLRDAAARHPEWVVARHEDLCVDTPARFRALADELGLEWGEQAERFVTESDRDGAPYRTNRRTEEQPDRWRDRLDDDQLATIRATLGRFPHALVPEA